MAFRLYQDPPPSPIDLCGSELIEQYFFAGVLGLACADGDASIGAYQLKTA
jgi:hypothetical protein